MQHEVLAAGRVRVGAVLLPDDADRTPDLHGMLEHVDARDRGAAAVGRVSEQSTRVIVDLPAPLGPSTPKIVPASTARLMPSSACTSGG